MEKENITEKQYEKYEKVRNSGITNMFAVGTVCNLSGLDKEIVLAIMKNYDYLMNKYSNVRQ